MNPPQTKPAKKLTYREKALAGLLPRKERKPVSAMPRKRLRQVAKSNAGRMAEYHEWKNAVMHGLSRCERCHERCQPLEPHHPYGRGRANLFRIVAICSACHEAIHALPNISMILGWLQPEIRGKQPPTTRVIPWKTIYEKAGLISNPTPPC